MPQADQDSFGRSPVIVIVDGNDIASALFMSSLNALAPEYIMPLLTPTRVGVGTAVSGPQGGGGER